MRHIYIGFGLITLIISALASCSKTEIIDDVKSDSEAVESRVFYAVTPKDTLTKSYIDPDLNILWTADDRLSVFRGPANEQYRYTGQTGRDEGQFEKVSGDAPSSLYSHNYGIYPYAAGNSSTTEGSISITLPATQSYAVNSFGLDANTMAAVTATADENTFKFKNVCGYLLLKVYGGDIIRRIVFRGNNGEKIAGAATLTASYGETPTVAMTNTSTTEITLDCGDDGVPTGATKDECTNFWMVVPPTTFTGGFTVEITNTDDQTVTKSTSKSMSITRNVIQPMAAIKVDTQADNDLLTFSLSDGTNTYEAFDISNGYVNVQVPNGTDMTAMTATFTHNGAKVTVGSDEQTSGEGTHDFSDFVNPLTYTVTSRSGVENPYIIRMFDLPVMIVNTNDKSEISSKVDYKPCQIRLIDKENSADYSFVDLDANIKGRGNSTWTFPKKPYNIKLSTKINVLGMPKHKKWCLLANYCDRTLIRNAFCQQIGRSASGFDWIVKGKHIDLIINGTHRGNYYLCEKIEVDENRVNIDKEEGYLLEYDSINDDYHFTSPLVSELTGRTIYVKLKAPVESVDEDPSGTILNIIKDYILEMEDVIVLGAAHNFDQYVDVASSVDYFLIQELVGNWDVQINSNYMNKDKDGKLKAGPLWDFDLYTFSNNYKKTHYATKALYYPYLLQDAYYISNVKQRWLLLKSVLDESGIYEFAQQLALSIRRSALRDEVIWPVSGKSGLAASNGDNSLSIDAATLRILNIYGEQLTWLDNYINSLIVDYDDKSGGNEDYGDQDDQSGNFNFGTN